MSQTQNIHKNFSQFTELTLITKISISVGLLFFIFSLLLTSLFTSAEDIYGIWLLVIGWIGLLIFQFSWFANPLNLLALLLINHRPFIALSLSFIAFLLASQSFLFSEIPIDFGRGKIYIKEFGLGFYLWYFAQGLFLLGTFVQFFQAQKNGD